MKPLESAANPTQTLSLAQPSLVEKPVSNDPHGHTPQPVDITHLYNQYQGLTSTNNAPFRSTIAEIDPVVAIPNMSVSIAISHNLESIKWPMLSPHQVLTAVGDTLVSSIAREIAPISYSKLVPSLSEQILLPNSNFSIF